MSGAGVGSQGIVAQEPGIFGQRLETDGDFPDLSSQEKSLPEAGV